MDSPGSLHVIALGFLCQSYRIGNLGGIARNFDRALPKKLPGTEPHSLENDFPENFLQRFANPIQILGNRCDCRQNRYDVPKGS